MFSYYPSYSIPNNYNIQNDPLRRAASIQRQRQLEAARIAEARRVERLHRQSEEAAARGAYLQRPLCQRRSPHHIKLAVGEGGDGADEMPEQHIFMTKARRQFPPSRPLGREEIRPEASTSLGSSQVPPADISEQRPHSGIPVSIPILDLDGQGRSATRTPPSPSRSPVRPDQAQPPEVSLVRQGGKRRAVAASTIQQVWRGYAGRKRALAQLAAIDASFRSLQSAFTFPDSVDFVQSSSATTSDKLPLAYTPNNRPIFAFEDSAIRLLTQLDAVDSAGDAEVRAVRKESVNRIESALKALETRKLDAWKVQRAGTHSIFNVPASGAEPNDKTEAGAMEESLATRGLPDVEPEVAVEATLSEPNDIVIVDGTVVGADEEDTWVDAWDGTMEDERDAEMIERELGDSAPETGAERSCL